MTTYEVTIPDCPYGANDCPKVELVKDKIGSINFKINVMLVLMIFFHAADLICLLKVIA